MRLTLVLQKRAVFRTIRTALPKYKKNLSKLPPLTQLLTQDDGQHRDLDHVFKGKLEIYKQYFPESPNTVLLEALLNPKNDILNLLQIIDENLLTMTSFYVAVSFESLADRLQFNEEVIATTIVSPEFKRLCYRALFKMRYMEADELLKITQCLARLGFSEKEIIVKATLEMTRHMINDFSIHELESLGRSLERIEPIEDSNKSLVVVIKAALPLARARLISEKLIDAPDELKLPEPS